MYVNNPTKHKGFVRLGVYATSRYQCDSCIQAINSNEEKNIRKLLRHTYLLKWLIFNIETLVIKFALVSCPVLGQVCKVSFTKNEISKNQTLFTTIIVKSVLDSQWSKLYRRQNVWLFPEFSSISYVRSNLPSVLRSPRDRMKSLFYLV